MVAGVGMLALGEVRTGLVQHSGTVSPHLAARVLRLLPDERVRLAERPVAYADSPPVLTGVDCRLATASGTRVGCVGTVTAHACLVGGRVVQASSHAVLVRAGADRRRAWSHYLSRPGLLEVGGRADADDLARGFLGADPAPGVLNLGAVCDRLVNRVQVADGLDRTAPFRSRRTRFRWVVEAVSPTSPGPRVELAVEDEALRTMRLTVDAADVERAVALCEDVALHDWLLSTLTRLIERGSRGTPSDAQVVLRLRPVIEHLLHLWYPAARVDDALLPVWESLERRPGFTRQWNASVNRIRDQIAVSGVTLMSAVVEGNARRA